ncbi:MAG: leucine-rich repeat protein [Clostridia bacterium]|nr:leucine-rich repeat protein [Clostridia bacterium]
MKRILFAVGLLLAAVLLLAACGGAVQFKLNFIVDGEVYATIDTAGKEAIKMPEDPTKEGDTFDGWYWDKDTWQKPFTANSLLDAPLSSDMNVYAKWKIAESEELAPFIFTSTATTCTITGVKDKTVTELTIPDFITDISEGAFSGCINLTCITIPFVGARANVMESDTYQYPFGYIFGRSSYIGGTATTQHYYGNSTNYTVSTTYYIPSSLKSVTVTGGNLLYGAFYNCSGLADIIIGNGVTSVGDSAFSGCSSLEYITLPFVGARAEETANDTYQYYIGYIFGTSNYTGGTAIQQIYGITYYIPTSLKSVTVSSGNIPYGAFSGCSGLTNIIIGSGVTSIGKSAFSGCSGLTNITIPNSVTSIGNYAFSGCSGLTNITIPNSVTSIGDCALSGCSGLTNISVEGGNAKYHSNGNCIIETKSKTLITGCKDSIIPTDGSVTSIGDCAFFLCSSLEEITIPNSVTSIGSSAFFHCTGLTNITIPDSVTSIGDGAFSGCSSLRSIAIPDSVTSIEEFAFSNCNLRDVVIPNSVTRIESHAFLGTSITILTIPKSVTFIGENAFHYVGTLTWDAINCIQPFEINTIMDDYFEDRCSNIVLGTSYLTIPSGLFRLSRCKKITIPSSVVRIEEYAFLSAPSDVDFQGTKAQWNAIEKETNWEGYDKFTIHCTDGDIEKS